MRIKTTIIKFHCGNEGESKVEKRQQQYLGQMMETNMMSAFEAERIETRASEGKDCCISKGIEME